MSYQNIDGLNITEFEQKSGEYAKKTAPAEMEASAKATQKFLELVLKLERRYKLTPAPDEDFRNRIAAVQEMAYKDEDDKKSYRAALVDGVIEAHIATEAKINEKRGQEGQEEITAVEINAVNAYNWKSGITAVLDAEKQAKQKVFTEATLKNSATGTLAQPTGDAHKDKNNAMRLAIALEYKAQELTTKHTAVKNDAPLSAALTEALDSTAKLKKKVMEKFAITPDELARFEKDVIKSELSRTPTIAKVAANGEPEKTPQTEVDLVKGLTEALKIIHKRVSGGDAPQIHKGGNAYLGEPGDGAALGGKPNPGLAINLMGTAVMGRV